MLGYTIMTETQKHVPKHVGNKLKCSNCHFKGGITEGGRNGGISLVGVAARYPEHEPKAGSVMDLAAKINICFRTSMNGRPLPPQSKEMAGILAYCHWISKGLPIYGEIRWLGLKPVQSAHIPDRSQGAEVFGRKCSACHGRDGKGTPLSQGLKPAPPNLAEYSLTSERAFAVITNGYPGTAMPPFKDFAEDVRWGLVKVIYLKRKA